MTVALAAFLGSAPNSPYLCAVLMPIFEHTESVVWIDSIFDGAVELWSAPHCGHVGILGYERRFDGLRLRVRHRRPDRIAVLIDWLQQRLHIRDDECIGQ